MVVFSLDLKNGKKNTLSILALIVTISLRKGLLKFVILSHLPLKSPTHYSDQRCISAKIIHSVFFRTFVFLITEDKRTIIGKASFVKH